MLEWFRCPDKEITTIKDCLSKCRLDERCLTLPTLTLMAEEREWKGIPSTTQLLNGTMYEFLKLTQPYVVDPDSRAFMLAGTKHHAGLEEFAHKLNLPAEVALNIDRDIFDLLEPGDDGYALTDYKLWGSYRVAKALGIVEIGKQPDPTGAVYKSSGKWGKAGEPKMVPIFQQDTSKADNWEAELQLNRYRIMLEERGIKISRMQIQATVRDGGLAIAQSRGIIRNIYMIPVIQIDDSRVIDYFLHKEIDLTQALLDNKWNTPCNDKECWEGARCKGYCEVARNCPKGILYQQEGKE
jgi:hypothetical protein